MLRFFYARVCFGQPFHVTILVMDHFCSQRGIRQTGQIPNWHMKYDLNFFSLRKMMFPNSPTRVSLQSGGGFQIWTQTLQKILLLLGSMIRHFMRVLRCWENYVSGLFVQPVMLWKIDWSFHSIFPPCHHFWTVVFLFSWSSNIVLSDTIALSLLSQLVVF